MRPACHQPYCDPRCKKRRLEKVNLSQQPKAQKLYAQRRFVSHSTKHSTMPTYLSFFQANQTEVSRRLSPDPLVKTSRSELAWLGGWWHNGLCGAAVLVYNKSVMKRSAFRGSILRRNSILARRTGQNSMRIVAIILRYPAYAHIRIDGIV